MQALHKVVKRLKTYKFMSYQGNVYQNHNTGQEVAQQVKVPDVNPQILL